MSELKEEALSTIGRFRALNKALPDPQRLAAKFEVPLSEAKEWLEAFEPIQETKAPDKIRKPRAKKTSAVTGFMNTLIDSGSLWFAVILDLILNGIGFWIIGPEPVMKVGMVCVSVIVVLFSVRAWIKRDKLLWMMFALVASFMDASYVLLATDVQSENSGADTELVRLDKQVADDTQYLNDLKAMQLKNGQGYATQITDARTALDKSILARRQYISLPKLPEVSMSAKRVFTAIPDAIFSSRWDRWIALGVMLLIFSGLQLTIISATGVKWNENHDISA